jgi:outer membrane protein assembly factor BamB
MIKNLLSFVSLVFIISCTTNDQSVTEWRGPNRSGIYKEKNLQEKWKEEGPAEILCVENIGNGYGSPIVTDESIFITGEIDSMLILHCFDLQGKARWETPLGKEWTESYQGSRSAPTLIDSLLYVGTGMGNIYCLEMESGKIIWSKEFVKDFNGIYPMFGHSEAPVVSDDKVFWTPGGPEFNVVALNRFTGSLIWSNKGFGERSAYNQPAVLELPDHKVFVTFSAYHLMGFDCETGKMLWSQEQDNYPVDQRKPGFGDTHSNTVIYDKGNIYYAEGDGNCGVKLKLSEGGTKITEVWRNVGFDSYMGGIVKIGNYLYGGATAKNQIVSVDSHSGMLVDSLKIGTGVLISADKMLYYYNQRGIMYLLRYNNGIMKEVSNFKITKGSKEHFSHPVIKNGILYLRHGKTLIAYDIKET